MKNLRTHGKSTIVWVLMGMLVLGLGGYGATSFSSGRSAIGAVGSAEITADDYARALSNDLNALSQQAGRQVTLAEAGQMGLVDAVQARLYTTAALSREADRIGLSVSDAQVARVISEAQAFQGMTGQFDRNAYAAILRREGISEADFEADVREDEARLILQAAVAGGVQAPASVINATAGWIMERRDIGWRELGAADLATPIADPDEATLAAWHQANAARFTAPEIRKITYVWLTPEMLESEVQLDEQALRDLYAARAGEYQQPERRMVERLVLPDMDTANAARARIDAGERFETIVTERGLSLADIDLGEVTQAQLGDAGAAVFAPDAPGVVGPVQTDLGPALFAMNAILDPVDVSYEDALPDLRAEAAADRARRVITDRAAGFEDLLAGGARLEEMAGETAMELGQIDWIAGAQADHGAIDAYPAFREQAAAVTQNDFPQLYELDDGGVFALRLDAVVAPTLRPLDTVRDAVLADWRRGETQRQLLALAEDLKLEADAGPMPAPDGNTGATGDAPAGAPNDTPADAPVMRAETGLTRDGWIEGAPPALVAGAFALDHIGETGVVDADGRVFLVTLRAIQAADLNGTETRAVVDATGQRLNQSLQNDVFSYYVRGIQARDGVTRNPAVIDAVNARMP